MIFSAVLRRQQSPFPWRAPFCVLLLAAGGVGRAAGAQTPAPDAAPQPGSGTALGTRPAPRVYTGYTAEATRAQLTSRLDSLQRLDTLSASGRGRRDEINAIRRRLTQGDFQTGDRFLVRYSLEQRSDTVVVREGPVYSLQTWPDVSLRGVLRAELPRAVEQYVATYLRDPRTRVFPLTRIAITGSVPRPGYYIVDPDRQLSDALTLAGGPGPSGSKTRVTVLRGSSKVYETKAMQTALREGRTVDDLGIRSGDEIRIEEPKRRGLPSAQTIFFGISAITGLIVLIRSLYATQ